MKDIRISTDYGYDHKMADFYSYIVNKIIYIGLSNRASKFGLIFYSFFVRFRFQQKSLQYLLHCNKNVPSRSRYFEKYSNMISCKKKTD